MNNLKKYVDYLNTLHNANAGNENTIAESQVKNDFYPLIKVERQIGNLLYEKLIKENIVLILTGHAGDGKTSLLSQILLKGNAIKKKQALKVKEKVFFNNKSLFYVKDLSEFGEVEQYNVLKEGMENSENGSSIIISNVGPLMKNLKRYYEEKGIDLIDIESEILNAIDNNLGEKLEFDSWKNNVFIVNIAKINNTGFVSEFIDKIINPELWKDEFVNKENIIYKNFEYVFENKERVKKFVKTFYQWQYEHDQRSTIRQIVAHIAYSLTGNNTLEEANQLKFLDNNFAHFFFGYKNGKLDEEAQQIDSIRKIIELRLDEKKTEVDYKFFVEEDLSSLPLEIAEEFGNIFYDDISVKNFKENRKALRRLYYFWGKNNSKTNYLSNVYSEQFLEYLEYKDGKQEYKYLDEKIFGALYRFFTGQTLDSGNRKKIYLTLKREGNYVQNVQLILGKISKKDIKLEFLKSENFLEENEYKPYLRVRGNKQEKKIKLNYPLIKYFDELNEGLVKTKLEAHLSNGVDSLKAVLINLFKVEDQDEINFLITTNKGMEVYCLEIDKELEMYRD